MKNGASKHLKGIAVAAVYVLLSLILMYAIGRNQNYPSGSSVMNTIYRGEVVYDSIAEGNLFPVYDSNWYNGTEPLRYAAPLPAYLMALCKLIAAGGSFGGYILFNGILFLVAAFSFYRVGQCFGRSSLGFFMGILWFFMPVCLHVTYGEGDLGRMVCLSFLPMFFYTVERFLREGEMYQIVQTALSFLIFLLSDPEFAAMMGVVLVIYLPIYCGLNRGWKHVGELVGVLIGVVLLSSIWLLPALMDKTGEAYLTESLQAYFQSAATSLNFFERSRNGGISWYFGLVAFATAVFGIVCSGKRSVPGFVTALVLFILSHSRLPRCAFHP